jgi:signal transduction histidine kinase
MESPGRRLDEVTPVSAGLKTSRRRSAALPAPASTQPAIADSGAPNPAGLSRRRRTDLDVTAAEDSRLALAGLAHDARNMFAALKLYCDLLAEPGVLAPEHFHYADELKLVAQAGGRLVERLGSATTQSHPVTGVFSTPIDDLTREVARSGAMLAALAGARVHLEVECMPCPGRLQLSVEDLTRILVNLVRNACEAMPEGGRIRITVQQGNGANFLTCRAATSGPQPTAVVAVQDNGPGIPAANLERIFEPGFSTPANPQTGEAWTTPSRRGFGLNVVRRLAESAGGVARVRSRPGYGTRIEIELPLVPSGCETDDSREGTCVQC